MIYRSKAPLRIGLAGGGTDVSPYSDLYGGAILNATISMYSYATIEPLDNGQIEFISIDQGESYHSDATDRVAAWLSIYSPLLVTRLYSTSYNPIGSTCAPSVPCSRPLGQNRGSTRMLAPTLPRLAS